MSAACIAGGLTRAIESASDCTSVATDGTVIVWTDRTVGKVGVGPVDGGPSKNLLLSGGTEPESVLLVGGRAYVSLRGAGTIKSLDVFSKTGAVDFASSAGSHPGPLASDDANLYWLDQRGVEWCPLDGGCPDGGPILLAPVKGAFSLAVDSLGVYFTVHGAGSGVMRLAKPAP